MMPEVTVSTAVVVFVAVTGNLVHQRHAMVVVVRTGPQVGLEESVNCKYLA